jgi:hypothetical protein
MRSRILRRSSSVWIRRHRGRPPAALAALGPGQLGHLAEARRHVAEPGDLHLGAGRAGAGVAVEDLEDDHGAVHHRAAGLHLEVAGLGGRDLVVDQDGLDGPPAERRLHLLEALEIVHGGLVEHEAADLVPLAGPR